MHQKVSTNLAKRVLLVVYEEQTTCTASLLRLICRIGQQKKSESDVKQMRRWSSRIQNRTFTFHCRISHQKQPDVHWMWRWSSRIQNRTLTSHSKSGCHVVCHTRLLITRDLKTGHHKKIVSRISEESQARLKKLFNIASLTETCIKRYVYPI